MARPLEFDRDAALSSAMRIFWAKGFAATSTDDLLAAMRIGRQSLYNAFGNKRQLFLAALSTYQQNTNAGHIERLSAPASPLAGIEALLVGLIAADPEERALGCMGVGATGEFGCTDADLVRLREQGSALLRKRLLARVREGQERGEIDAAADAAEIAAFIQMTMTGIQLAARAGAGASELRRMARFTVERLKAR
jgi:AcrR family transcriptional regulator